MPLITLENKSAGLGQPSPNSFGPVEQFTYTLSSEMLLAPGSRVSLKRARFLVSAETYSVTRDNNKFAVIVNYDSNDAPPTGYDEVDRTTSGVVVKGEVPPGFYNGDSLANALEAALNEKLAEVDLLSGKDVEFSVVFNDSVTSTSGKDGFTISMKETKATVDITDPQLPSSLAVFDDSFERGENIAAFADKAGHNIETEADVAWVTLKHANKSISMVLNELNSNNSWSDAFGSLNNHYLSCATNVYDTLPVPTSSGPGNATSFTASMPINVEKGSNTTDNVYATDYTYGMWVALMTRDKAVELNNRYGVKSAYPLAALNMFEATEGIMFVSGITVDVVPGVDINGDPETNGQAQVTVSSLKSATTQSYKNNQLATFNENTRQKAPISDIALATTEYTSLKDDMAASDPTLHLPFTAVCSLNSDGSYVVSVEFDPDGKLVKASDGSVAGVFGGPATRVEAESEYIPVVFLSTKFRESTYLGEVKRGASLKEAVLWANVQQNVYKKSTSDAYQILTGAEAGTEDADEAVNIEPGTGTTQSALVVADDNSLIPCEVSVQQVFDPTFAGSAIDVSHIEDGAEFDLVLTSAQWHNALVEYNVFNIAYRTAPHVLPVFVTHGSQTVARDPFAASVLHNVMRSGGDRTHPAWSAAEVKHPHASLTYFDSGDPANPSEGYASYDPASRFELVPGDLPTGPLSMTVRLVKEQGVSTARLALPAATYSYDNALKTIPLSAYPDHTSKIADLEVSTLPVVHHAANLRGAPPLVTYKGNLGRHALPQGYSPYHADPSTDLMAFGSNHVEVSEGAKEFKGVFLYLNQLWSMLGVYVPGKSKTDASWVAFESGDSVTSNANPDPFDFKSGICVHLRNIPITSYLSNGQSSRVIEFLDDQVQKSAVFSRVVDNKDRRMYEVLYEAADPTEHVINSSQTVRARNLDVLLTDFSGRTFDTNTTTAANPIYSVSLTLDFRLPNPLLERIAAKGQGEGEGNPRKRSKASLA